MTTRATHSVAIGLLLVAAGTAADCIDTVPDALTTIVHRGALRVAATGDYAPFNIRAADGKHGGIDADLAELLAQELGVSLQWVDTSWPALSDDLRGHQFDIAMSGISITPARAAEGCFTKPYFATGKTVLARCARALHFEALEELDRPDLTVIVNPGGTNEQFVRRHFTAARIVMHPDNRSIFDALARGGADFMVTDAVEAQLQADAYPALCIPSSGTFETVAKAYLIPADARLKALLDTWLERLRDAGTLEAIIKLHTSPNAAPAGEIATSKVGSTIINGISTPP